MATAPNTETFSQKIQETNANPDGCAVGQSGTDKVGFYGALPLAQRINSEICGAGTSGASIITATFSTAGGTSSTKGWADSAFTSQFGNWYTSSVSISGASTSYYATGYSVGNLSLMSAAATANIPAIGLVVAEICKTLVGLGIWKAT